MRSCRHQHGVADTDEARQGIVGVGSQDDVDALDAPGQLAVDIKTVVGQQHDDGGALRARLLDLLLQLFLANAEFPLRKHPARVGDGRARQRLPDHGDFRAAAIEQLARLEHRLLPFIVANVLGQEGERRFLGDLQHALGAVGELPVPDHRIGLERRLHVDHVLRLGLQRSPAALPAVAAIEQDHIVLAAFGPYCFHQRGDAVHAAHSPVVARQRGEVVGC
ncbi:hypothetical protein ES703_123653 [subsurface metagenome]